ncbi:MAG TPA: ROK family protein [Candidatus Anaerostipes avistercoris]|uniref:ROK family protein n=1 Tax=Candidatus Anaerostipes avistercoris TaxID=2838462 RepID=A0A9D2PK23_9FIRM|nr:ROK family protein [Candidatus Anaerostipes avistercoris]
MSCTFEIKQLNQQLIRDVLRSGEIYTKADIGRETGLSLATCGTILNEMLAEKEVLETSRQKSRGGRPAACYQYNKDYYRMIGIYADNGNECGHLGYVVYNALEEVIEEGREEVGEVSPEAMLVRLDLLMETYENVRGISVGIPGIVSGGKILSCDIGALERVNLEEMIREKYQVYVSVSNDMNYIAYGAYDRQNSEEDLTVLYFPQNHYAGCGSIVNGELLCGAGQMAGELSYLYRAEGIPRPESGGSGEPAEFLGKILIYLTALLNPARILMISHDPERIPWKEAAELCRETLGEAAVPEIEMTSEFYENYIHGLAALTLHEQKYRI